MIIRIPLGTYALNRDLIIRLARLPTKKREQELEALGEWLKLRAMTDSVKPGEIQDYGDIVAAFSEVRLRQLSAH